MPVIKVFGLPHWTDGVDTLRADIAICCVKLHTLELSKDSVIVHIVPELGNIGSNHPVTVWVEGLLDKPERTLQVRNHLAHRLSELVSSFLRERTQRCRLVEVRVCRFDPEVDGYAETRLDTKTAPQA